MSPEGIRENRKKFMDRIGQTRRANELNAGSATRPSGRPEAGVGGLSGGGGGSPGGSGLSSASETAFAKDVYNKAIAAGIPETQAQMAAMQATLESQHGTSDLARRGSNNYFGIKGKGEAGTSGGYAAYSSPEAGLKAWLLLVQRKWPGAASAKTVQEGIEAEHHGQRGGYSETPNYGERIAQTERRTKGFNSGEPTGEPSQVGQAERPSHIGGMIDVEGQKYHFGSGVAGYESIPYGNYPITPNTIGAWGQAHGAMGINNNKIWDEKLGRNRNGIEFHAGMSDQLLTKGCMAIAGKEWPQFKVQVKSMIAQHGHAYLHVGTDGARVTPEQPGQPQRTPPQVVEAQKPESLNSQTRPA